jgi:hypothetical protein
LEALLGLFFLGLLICIYCAPAIIAGARSHHQQLAIGALNLLLGWTIIGWVIALVWACTAVQNQTSKQPQNRPAWQPTGTSQATEPRKTEVAQPGTKKRYSGQIPTVILSACFALFLIVLLVSVFVEPGDEPVEKAQVVQKAELPATSNASSSVPIIKRPTNPSSKSETAGTKLGEVPLINTPFTKKPPDKWVTVDRLNRRTCPSTSCGVVGQLFYRNGVTSFETRGGWIRITKYYIDASCLWSDVAEFVDGGRNDCSSANGFRDDGSFAEWVSAKYLSKTRPPDPSAGRTGLAKIIGDSDDFRLYEAEFLKAAKSLIQSGRCKPKDFEYYGGWLKSTTTYKHRPVYFTYCGKAHVSNRIYLDVSNGQIFQ